MLSKLTIILRIYKNHKFSWKRNYNSAYYEYERHFQDLKRIIKVVSRSKNGLKNFQCFLVIDYFPK